MSAQRLSPRSVRRIAASTGLDVVRGWSHGDTVLTFATRDHQHGTWHRRTGAFTLDPPGSCRRYASCPPAGQPITPEPTAPTTERPTP